MKGPSRSSIVPHWQARGNSLLPRPSDRAPLLCTRRNIGSSRLAIRALTAIEEEGMESAAPQRVEALWDRTLLLRRELDIAVREESFSLAARLHAEIQVLLDRLPASRSYTYRLLETILDESSSDDALQDALSALSLVADPSVLPEVHRLLLTRPRLEPEVKKTYMAIKYNAVSRKATDMCHRSASSFLVSAALGSEAAFEGREEMLMAAIAMFTAALEEDQECAQALAGRGTAFYYLKKFERAIEDLEAATLKDPFDCIAARMLALAKGQLKEFSTAYRVLASTLVFNPSLENSPEHITILETLRQWEESSLDWHARYKRARELTSVDQMQKSD